jgi:hypothetical protein
LAEDVLWEQTRGKWGAEATELVCSLASTSETKEIINRSLLNAILLSPVLPATLSRAELVYFYKKGDPLDLQSYRGTALQSVL